MEDKNRTKADTLRLLNHKIQQIQGFKQEAQVSAVSLHPQIDQSFLNQAFPLGAVHEFYGQGHRSASALGFMAAIISLVAVKDQPALWITKSQEIFPQGLALFGIEPHRIIFMQVRRDCEALWAMEEGLRCKALAVTVGEVSDADLTATRRLQLAVEQSGVTGFLLRGSPKSSTSSACFSSWNIQSLPSHLDDGLPGVGFPRWRVELRKIRNGQPAQWDVEWKAGCLHMIEEQRQIRVPDKVYAI